jgi:hypothetical protein
MVVGFDNNRQGLILSAGLGNGVDIISPQVRCDSLRGNGDVRTNASLCMDLKLGCNFDNHIGVAYVNKSDFMMPYTETILNNVNAIEFAYYFRDQAPSFYCNGSLGLAFWLYPFDAEWNRQFNGNGLSFSIGSGFEFAKHISLQAEYMFSMPQNKSQIQSTMYDGSISTRDFYQINYTNVLRLTLLYTLY